MDPRNYWKERSQLEMGLDGDIWVHLFRKGHFILARRLGTEFPTTPEDTM
jgi:hypothetical protein